MTKGGIPGCDSCSKTLLYYYNNQVRGKTQAVFGWGLRTTSPPKLMSWILDSVLHRGIHLKKRWWGRSPLGATYFPKKIMLVSISLLLSRRYGICCPYPGWTSQPLCCSEDGCSHRSLLSPRSKSDLCFLNEGAYEVFFFLRRCQAMNHGGKGGISWLAVLSPRKRHIPRIESFPSGLL